MAKGKPIDTVGLIDSLTLVKVDISAMKDAMPTMARELRREALERLDDVMDALRGGGR